MGDLKIFDQKGDLDLLKNTLTLQLLSECCVCMLPLSPSHSLCETGHGVCGKCKVQLTQCPMCKGKFILNNAVLLNQILELLPKPCRYHDKGCTFVAGCSIKEHEEYCIFRPSYCKVINCQFEGTVKNLVDHVKSAHADKVMEIFPNSKKSGQLFFKNMSSHAICCTPVFYEGNLFWKYCHKDRAKRLMVHVFYHVPFAKPTKSYVLKVEFDKIEEKLICPSQVETNTGKNWQSPETSTEQKAEIPKTSAEPEPETSDSSTKIKVEISETALAEPKLETSDEVVDQKLEISAKPNSVPIQKIKLDSFEKNDVLISTALLSRKRDKRGGYRYYYAMSVEEENMLELEE